MNAAGNIRCLRLSAFICGSNASLRRRRMMVVIWRIMRSVQWRRGAACARHEGGSNENGILSGGGAGGVRRGRPDDGDPEKGERAGARLYSEEERWDAGEAGPISRERADDRQ